MTRQNDIINAMTCADHIKDSNTHLRRFFRCWIDGSYNGEGHYRQNCDFVRTNYTKTKRLRTHAISEFTSYMAREHDCSYGHAQKAIVASMPADKLAELTMELIDDLRDLVRDQIIDDSFNDFVDAYLQTAIWSSTCDCATCREMGADDNGGLPMDDNHDIDDINDETHEAMVEDCRKFYDANVESIFCLDAPIARDTGDNSAAMAGHDFWLNRNGHGAGFWDGDWPEPHANTLDDASKQFGEVNLYVGDDGQIYSM